MYVLNRHSKYKRAKHGKMASFVSQLNWHLNKQACPRAWTRAWGKKTKSPAHLIFSWHGGRLRFSRLKSPCTKTDRHRKRATDREGEVESGQILGTMTHRSARLLQWCSIDSFIQSEAAARLRTVSCHGLSQLSPLTDIGASVRLLRRAVALTGNNGARVHPQVCAGA